MRTNLFAARALIVSLGLALLGGGCISGDQNPKPQKHRPVHLAGSIKRGTYYSPDGGFSVPVPVSGEVNGRVLTDGPRSVTFTDNWGSRITIGSQQILTTSSMAVIMDKDGREKALTEFAQRGYGDLIEPHYHADILGGLLSFVYLHPVTPKTAVAIFVHDNRLFAVETDLKPGEQLLAPTDLASQGQRDVAQEDLAVRLAQSIEIR